MVSPSEQPRNMTFVPDLNVHLGLSGGLANGSIVKLLPVQIPFAVPLTNQGCALGTVLVLPMTRNEQSPLGVSNVMPVTRPETHSKRHDSIVNLAGPLDAQVTAKTKSRFARSVADRPFTVRPPPRKQP